MSEKIERARLRQVVARELHISDNNWQDSDDLLAMSEVDSLRLMELIAALETEFAIRIDIGTLQLGDIKSVNGLMKTAIRAERA